MRTPPIGSPSITDDERSPVEQLEILLGNPHSELLRRRFFGVLAAMDSPAEVEPWILAARELRERGIIDDDGWVYFVSIFMECLTFGDGVTDPELVRIQHEIDMLDASESAIPHDDDDEYDPVEGSPEMRALFAAYDARSRGVTAEYLRQLGYRELADVVEWEHDAYLDKSEAGANKLFDGAETADTEADPYQ